MESTEHFQKSLNTTAIGTTARVNLDLFPSKINGNFEKRYLLQIQKINWKRFSNHTDKRNLKKLSDQIVVNLHKILLKRDHTPVNTTKSLYKQEMIL